ncbi:hypothetical protein Bca101_075875 [Brassica carinata]
MNKMKRCISSSLSSYLSYSSLPLSLSLIFFYVPFNKTVSTTITINESVSTPITINKICLNLHHQSP